MLNQCFWPDVVATAQQLTELSEGLRAAGHEVTVIASRSGYDNPNLRFPRRGRWNGVEIVRVRSLAMGKKTRWQRAVNFASYFIACAGRLLLTPRHDVVVALTSPPLISWLAVWFTRLKGGRLVFWPMDLNPDEAIAAGWLRRDSIAARLLSRMLMTSMQHATRIVALDRFMKDRLVAKGVAAEKIEVVPPVAGVSVQYDQEGREEFRRRHGLSRKFVVMYAGNHSPCNPLDTLLDGAKLLRNREDILFLFVGGGSGLDRVKEQAVTLPNVRWLPYQAQADLPAMLSAADLHTVVLGEQFSGIIHPSKIYNIMAVRAPFLFIGPMESFIGDLVANGHGNSIMQVGHDQAERLAQIVSEAANDPSFRKHPRTTDEVSTANTISKLVALIEMADSAAESGFVIKPSRASVTHT